MQSLTFSAITATVRARRFAYGRSWMEPSFRMHTKKASGPENDLAREPFVTIDDLLQQTEELLSGLQKLSEYSHPLEVRRGLRKGVRQCMKDDKRSKQIKGAGRTYFLDIEQTKEGKAYLRITESRKGDGDKFERNSINVFPEDLNEFAAIVSAIAGEIVED